MSGALLKRWNLYLPRAVPDDDLTLDSHSSLGFDSQEVHPAVLHRLGCFGATLGV
jgi:hypothetical protein